MKKNPVILPRKTPQQARSSVLVDAVLQAAVQVLAQQGAQRFTMARVAEKAGVSVGSLYQYFPNKAAILFRLQSDEWRQTSDMLRRILQEPGRPPFERLRTLVLAFIRSECEEAGMRGALDDAAPLYRDAPEARHARTSGERGLQSFMREVLSGAPLTVRRLAVNLTLTTLSAVGKQFSEAPRSPREIAVYADALADMFCGYLQDLGRKYPA